MILLYYNLDIYHVYDNECGDYPFIDGQRKD